MSLTTIRPNSSFKLSVTVKEGDVLVTGAQVTVTLYSPSGAAVFTNAELLHEGQGLYVYEAPANSVESVGIYTAEFKSINGTIEGRERLRFLVSH